MNQSHLNDEVQAILHHITGELNRYSEKYPDLRKYSFHVEDHRWIARTEYPFPVEAEEGYYLRNLRKLTGYIERYYPQDISELFAADRIGLSVPEFCRFFKKQTGMTFVSYKNKVRVEQAARLLIESDCSCEQVGWDCGFSSYHYFKRVFEKYYGVSPKRFRLSGGNR